MKMKFEMPKAEMIYFELTDIIATSDDEPKTKLYATDYFVTWSI